MNAERNDGGPAFPTEWTNHTDRNILVGGVVIPPGGLNTCLGMSLRDYFAAKAMQAYIARDDWSPRVTDNEGFDELVSRYAYEAADAMLKARAA